MLHSQISSEFTGSTAQEAGVSKQHSFSFSKATFFKWNCKLHFYKSLVFYCLLQSLPISIKNVVLGQNHLRKKVSFVIFESVPLIVSVKSTNELRGDLRILTLRCSNSTCQIKSKFLSAEGQTPVPRRPDGWIPVPRRPCESSQHSCWRHRY